MILRSLLGACGSGFLRNSYALIYGANDSVTIYTIIWEWSSLFLILVDFTYFLVCEHTWVRVRVRVRSVPNA